MSQVDDLSEMGGAGGVGDPDRNLEGPRPRAAAPSQASPRAVLPAFGDVRASRRDGDVPVLADFIDGADVRVIQAGRRPRLEQEALSRGPVTSRASRQHLQGDGATKRLVVGQIDGAHPAPGRPQEGANHVMSDLSPWRKSLITGVHDRGSCRPFYEGCRANRASPRWKLANPRWRWAATL